MSQQSQAVAHNVVDGGWDHNFILNKVVPKLAEKLGSEWSMLVILLPGWEVDQAQDVVDQKKKKETTVKNRFSACMMEWVRQYPNFATKANILKTLQEIGRADLHDDLNDIVDLC